MVKSQNSPSVGVNNDRWESWVYMRVWPLGSPSLSLWLIGTSAKIKDPVFPAREPSSLGKGERRNPSKTYTPACAYAQTHLQVVSLLPFFSQAPETQMFLLLYLLRFGVASNTQLMCPLFYLSVIFSSLWSHHLLHYSADRTLKFYSRESTVFVCLPQDSAVFILLIIHQGSVFLKIPSGCKSIMKV